jgi:hypothetical protein
LKSKIYFKTQEKKKIKKKLFTVLIVVEEISAFDIRLLFPEEDRVDGDI